MAARLYLVAGKVTDSVTRGFLPAALRLGLEVTVLTDRVAEHEAAYGPPGGPGMRPGVPPVRVEACDVTDFREIVSAVGRHGPAAAIFSNSDHLQAQTALAAAYHDLPGKDWRAALRTKNKALMRAWLAERGRGAVACAVVEPGADPGTLRGLPDAPFPLVVKPREGVASEDVVMVSGPDELADRCREIRARRPGAALLVEEYLPGTLHTLETLGDGRTTAVLGSYRTTLSPPPYFVEERLDWAPEAAAGCTGEVLGQLAALGVGFGACHTEFVVHAGSVRLVEVNYRIIGDHCDFLLADLLDVPVFEYVLRVHLGEPLPRALLAALPRRPGGNGSGAAGGAARHALVDSVIAERSGTLTAAPGPRDVRTADGVRLAYLPTRAVGEPIVRTNTNRDFLGTIRAIGPDRTRVEAAVARFRGDHRWEITR